MSFIFNTIVSAIVQYIITLLFYISKAYSSGGYTMKEIDNERSRFVFWFRLFDDERAP